MATTAVLYPKKALFTIVFSSGALEKAMAFTVAMEEWYLQLYGKPLAPNTYYRSEKGYVVTVEIEDENYLSLLTRAERWCKEEGGVEFVNQRP